MPLDSLDGAKDAFSTGLPSSSPSTTRRLTPGSLPSASTRVKTCPQSPSGMPAHSMTCRSLAPTVWVPRGVSSRERTVWRSHPSGPVLYVPGAGCSSITRLQGRSPRVFSSSATWAWAQTPPARSVTSVGMARVAFMAGKTSWTIQGCV